ncbi:MAG: RT0821/Lpp0805 family surface protein [Alphaproteobacteria bacterium]
MATAFSALAAVALLTFGYAPGAAYGQQAADDNCAMMVGWKTAVGAVAGGAVGAGIGSAFGHGTGGLFGGLFGGAVGGAIGNALDRADCDAAHAAWQRSLDNSPPGQSTTWTNPDTGHSGTFTQVSSQRDTSGRTCRTYRSEVNVEKGQQAQSGQPAKPAQPAQPSQPAQSGQWVQPGQKQPAQTAQQQPAQQEQKGNTSTACRNSNGEWEVVNSGSSPKT